MSQNDLTLVDAIQIAMEAEKKAAALYRGAAETALFGPLRSLFGGLADFEQHHYGKLTDLADSLREAGKYIVYKAPEVSIPAQSEIEVPQGAVQVLDGKETSLMGVLTLAQDVEKQADKRYAALAAQTSDPDGKAMFLKLAEEEQAHLKVLTGMYFDLNDRGVVSWPEL